MDRKLQAATMSCWVPLQFWPIWRPLQYSLSLEKAQWTKISSTLNNKLSVLHQQKWTYLIQRAAWPKRKINRNFGLTTKYGNFEPMLPVNHHQNKSMPKSAPRMQDGIECTNTYGDALSMLKWICHQNETWNTANISCIQWCTDHIKLITDNIVNGYCQCT